MILVAVGVGLALLFFGRQLFWLFVAGAGFAFATIVTAELLKGLADWAIVIAILAGIIGALLAIVLQRLAIGLGGFLMGGYLAFTLTDQFDASLVWPAFFIGGILGALLVLVLFDWALIVLSSLTGAVLIVGSVNLEPPIAYLACGLAFLAGLAVQAGQLKKRRRAEVEQKR